MGHVCAKKAFAQRNGEKTLIEPNSRRIDRRVLNLNAFRSESLRSGGKDRFNETIGRSATANADACDRQTAGVSGLREIVL
jgi:hypothetical protein